MDCPKLPELGHDAEHPLRARTAAGAWLSRVSWIAVWGVALGSLVVGRMLKPEVGGMGAHVQLGLPPCSFTQYTGLPCPGCGVTTSFALSLHGALGTALSTHGAGPVLALVCVVVGIYAPFAVRRCHSPARVLRTRAAYLLACAVLAAWTVTYVIRLMQIPSV